jgi:hypothetical protein
MTSLIAVFLDLNPQFVSTDLSDTAERISRYAWKQLARDAQDRLQLTQNDLDREVSHYYLNQSEI